MHPVAVDVDLKTTIIVCYACQHMIQEHGNHDVLMVFDTPQAVPIRPWSMGALNCEAEPKAQRSLPFYAFVCMWSHIVSRIIARDST